MKNITKNQYLITIDFFRYLPSRFYVISNILLILPFFSKMLSVKEMGIFQIGISMLNLVCTIFFDWISKIVLRYYDENKLKNELNEFFTNILILFIFNYILLIIIYFLFGETLCNSLHTDKLTILSVMIVVIPCLVRQFLYQMLRLLNRTVLYTTSIVVYQILLISITMLLINYGSNKVTAIFFAMAIAITIIDVYIIKCISKKISFRLSKYKNELINKFLKYGIPLVCTNFFIWNIINYNKYFYRSAGDFNATGEIALAAFLTTSILSSIFSTLLFAIFPRIVKRYATKRNIKPFLTDTVKIYIVYFLPLTMIFCLFPKNILDIFSNNQYTATLYVLPFFAISIFLHELGKIINIKYHLANKNYIDTLIALISGAICIILTGIFNKYLGIIGTASAMLIGFILWITINSIIKCNNERYINWPNVFKTLICSIIICIAAYFIVINFTTSNNGIQQVIQMLAYMALCYFILFEFKKFILE